MPDITQFLKSPLFGIGLALIGFALVMTGVSPLNVLGLFLTVVGLGAFAYSFMMGGDVPVAASASP